MQYILRDNKNSSLCVVSFKINSTYREKVSVIGEYWLPSRWGYPHSSQRGGYPILSNKGYSILPNGGYPIPGQDKEVPPFQVRTGGGDTPIPGHNERYPHLKSGQGVPPSQVRTGGTPIPGQDRGYSGVTTAPSRSVLGQDGGGGYPRTRIAQHVLATRQAVCLLRSGRRTFLFGLFLHSFRWI